MIIGVVCFLAGLLGGAVGVLTALKRTALPERRTVIHLRSPHPGIFKDRLCEECKYRGYKVFAEYLDQDTRAWCGRHLPKNTKYAERAVNTGDGHATGPCMAHGMDCPKPWSLV